MAQLNLSLNHPRPSLTFRLFSTTFISWQYLSYQSPTPRPRRGSWKQVCRGLLCRAKYGGGPVSPRPLR